MMVAVFVPSMLGVGVLVSLAVLAADVARRLLPGTEFRRLRSTQHRSIELTAPIVSAAGRAPGVPPAIVRCPRRRATYGAVAIVGVVLAIYVSIGSTGNYLREGGYLHDVLWVQVVSLVASGIFLAIGIVAAVAAIRYTTRPRWLDQLIAATPLGTPDLASLRRRPRPRPLRTHPVSGPDDAVAWFDHARDEGRVVVAFPSPSRGATQLAGLRDSHDELDAHGVRVIVVAPQGERHRLSRSLAPLIVTSDPESRLVAHLGLVTNQKLNAVVLLVERDGRVTWRHRQRREAAEFRARRLLGAIRRRHPGLLTPSDVLGPMVATLVAVVFVLLGALAISADGVLLSWDRPVRRAVTDLGGASFERTMRLLTQLGSRRVLALLAVPMILLSWRRCRRFALVFACALPAGLVLELLVKWLVDRPRPPLGNGFGASFPSGHVVASVAFWGLLPPFAMLMTRRRDVWLASVMVGAGIVTAVAASRVYLGAHWPSDAAGGLLVGALFLLAAEWVIHNPAPGSHAEECPLHPPAPARRAGE